MEAEEPLDVIDLTAEFQQPMRNRQVAKAAANLDTALDQVLANTSDGIWPKLFELGLESADARVYCNQAGEFWISVSELINSNIVRQIQEAYPTAVVMSEQRPTGEGVWRSIAPPAGADYAIGQANS